MVVSIREFQKEDIPYKVKWINDEKNNKYLHYDLPLREDKTLQWFNSLKNRPDRIDYTITFDGEPAGIIGLLDIDNVKKEAEYYICLGEEKFKGRGIAEEATKLLIKKAYYIYELNQLYLYTELKNIQAQKLFEKVGFFKQVLIKNDLFHNGRSIDRYLYKMDLDKYLNSGIGV